MNKFARWLSLWVAVWTAITGGSEPILNEEFKPASWTLIYGWLPAELDWIWPTLFVVTGLACFVGFFSTRMVIIGFCLCSLAYAIWGTVSMIGWRLHEGGTVPGSSAYYNLSGMALLLAYFIYKNSRIEEKVAHVEQAELEAHDLREESDIAVQEARNDLATR